MLKLVGKHEMEGGPGHLEQCYCWRPILIGGHLNIIVGGPFKLIGKN